jgi:hypothetical protein
MTNNSPKPSSRKIIWKRSSTRIPTFVLSLLFGLGMAGQIIISRTLNPFFIENHDPNFNKPQESTYHKELPKQRQRSDNIWQWHNYSAGKPIRQPSKRLLITQYSGFGKYEKLLNLTSPINKMYAKAWGHDMLLMRGTTKRFPFQKNRIPEEQSMYNKVDLLLLALENNEDYDQVLVLDSDTLIYDFSVDITQMISGENKMLVALKTHELDPPETYRINNGVTLWNLHHPLTKTVASDWNKGCIEGIKGNFSIRGDQHYLVEALKVDDRKNSVRGVLSEFHYRSATVIKHFIRQDSCSWHGSGLNEREEGIRNASTVVAHRFQFDQKSMEFHNTTTLLTTFHAQSTPSTPTEKEDQKMIHKSESSKKSSEIVSNSGNMDFASNTPGCQPKRMPTWDFHSFHRNSSEPTKKRLLIAQYTSFGSDDKYLNMTVRINKYYARHWGHDLVIVKGAAFKTPLDDSPCEVPPKRSMYNKFAILSRAMKNRDNYDQLIMLHDGALFYDLEYDVTELLNESTLLVATRSNKCDAEKTAMINSAVSMWNLHHSKLEKVIQSWFKHMESDLKNAKKQNLTAHGEQHCLQRALRKTGLQQYIRAKFEEFNGQVMKQFPRSNRDLWGESGIDIRETEIKQALTEVCDNFPADCENMDKL